LPVLPLRGTVVALLRDVAPTDVLGRLYQAAGGRALTEQQDEPRPNGDRGETKPITDSDLAEIDIDITKLIEEFELELELAGKA
jgi:hypothetical protein